MKHLIKEADEIIKNHRSKDARAFAKAVKAELDRLKEYAEHKADCAVMCPYMKDDGNYYTDDCNCGLDELLKKGGE